MRVSGHGKAGRVAETSTTARCRFKRAEVRFQIRATFGCDPVCANAEAFLTPSRSVSCLEA